MQPNPEFPTAVFACQLNCIININVTLHEKYEKKDYLKIISDVESKKEKAFKEYNSILIPLNEKLRLAAEKYIDEKAKFKLNEKVIVTKPLWQEKTRVIGFIGKRELSHDNNHVKYFVLKMKKDGSPSMIYYNAYSMDENNLKAQKI